LVDPPYGLGKRLVEGGKKGGMGSLRKLADSKVEGWDKIPTEEYFIELKRVSKNQIIWGGNYFLDYLGSNDGLIIWDKMNGTNALADAEIAWKSLSGTTRVFRMHHFSAGYEDKIHPTQKPTKLYEWILNKYANENDKILDTHFGAIAIDKANTLDKKNLTFVGIELDTDYYNAALNRFKNYKSQKTIFDAIKD
jgi:site-specific DNA-methyltransferase (adenine-specific)